MNYDNIKQIKMSSPKYRIVSLKTKAVGFKDLAVGDVIYFTSTINRIYSNSAHSTYIDIVCEDKTSIFQNHKQYYLIYYCIMLN